MADFDAAAVKRVDANTIGSVRKKAGKVVGGGRRSISADGTGVRFGPWLQLSPAPALRRAPEAYITT